MSSEKTGYVSFWEDICQLLGICTEDTFGIFYDTLQNLYHMGPIFGIFAYRESHYMGPFALQTYYFRKLIKLSQNKGMLAYVFAIWDIDLENHRVEGYTYNFEKEEWTKQFFPLPDVIYDRGDVIHEDNYGQYALDYLEYIKKNNIKLINSIECIEITNNKWFTYKLLDANEYTRKYLPHTWEYKSPNLLLKKLDQYEHLFLKMKDGSRSKGIFSIQKVADCSYIIYYKNIYGYNVRTSLLKKHLIEWLDVKIKETACMREHYIIQQAIHFTKYQGGNFEVRVVMQKKQ